MFCKAGKHTKSQLTGLISKVEGMFRRAQITLPCNSLYAVISQQLECMHVQLAGQSAERQVLSFACIPTLIHGLSIRA